MAAAPPFRSFSCVLFPVSMCPVFLCADWDAHRGLVDGLANPNWRPRPPIMPSLATLLIAKIAIMLLDPQIQCKKELGQSPQNEPWGSLCVLTHKNQ